ncbi:hypothetical protein [Alkalimonas amylolytica]|uniref:MSHA biogenesis protein MshI n=1 Tax=Alkalimonas amylolytica TaxID=152573 RepID=A0A1H4FSS9_ALKAM|nr:hypothetical protein [Alkalimonas amylolytica]SEB00334.1 MSHA biogenesis protein MshI [Alkalimonas amylolytica]
MWASLRKLFDKQTHQQAVAALHWQDDGCSIIVLTKQGDSMKCTFRRTLNFQGADWSKPLEQCLKELPMVTDVVLVLAPEFYQLVQVDKPQVPEAELKAALRWQLKELVSLELDDMQFDYLDLPSSHQQQAARLQMVVSSQDLLQQLVGSLHRARLPITTILPEEWLLKDLIPAQPQPTLVLSHRSGQDVAMMIVRGEQVCFSRRIRGIQQLEQLSLDALHQGYLDTLGLEVQRSVDYFEGQMKQAPVRHMFLALDTELQEDIAGFFRELGFAKVELLDFGQWLPDVPLTQQAQFAVPLAAAMGSEVFALQEARLENAS